MSLIVTKYKLNANITEFMSYFRAIYGYIACLGVVFIESRS